MAVDAADGISFGDDELVMAGVALIAELVDDGVDALGIVNKVALLLDLVDNDNGRVEEEEVVVVVVDNDNEDEDDDDEDGGGD